MKVLQDSIGKGIHRISHVGLQSQVNTIVSDVYTPVVGTHTGSLTTVSASGVYNVISIDTPSPIAGAQYFMVFLDVVINITTNGTGAGFIFFNVPQTVDGFSYNCTGQGMISGSYFPLSTGLSSALVAQVFGGVVELFKYDSTYPGADNTTHSISGWYQSQVGP